MSIPEGEDETFYRMQITGDNMQFQVDDRTINMYQHMTNDQFTSIASNIFEYYFVDEINVKLRKMLTIEQYRNASISKLYRDLSFDDAINFQSELFASLMKVGCFIKTDPYMLAMAFFFPYFSHFL